MALKVVFYTRSGYSRSVAERIAKRLNCELIQVTDGGNWKGILGFFRGGYYATKQKDVVITVHGEVNPADELIAVAPLWAGKVLPAMRVFFKSHEKSKAHYVVTSNGVTLREREGFKSVTDIVRRFKNEDEVLERLYTSVKSGT